MRKSNRKTTHKRKKHRSSKSRRRKEWSPPERSASKWRGLIKVASRWWSWAFIVYTLGGVAFGMRIDVVNDAHFQFAFTWLYLPCFSVILWALLRPGRARREGPKRYVEVEVFLALVIAAMIVGPLVGWLSYANTILGEQRPTRIEGVVSKRGHSRSSRFGPKYRVELQQRDGTRAKFGMSADQYDSARVGEEYGHDMTTGGFGFVYRWR